ncbi:uncharacterized protein LOC122016267 [Zingiber officinale]|uniref:uncharacterized protein LOC122016267 n=1 Tax=Zingiber officinale TaxID=94328 RepID=UPI001C4D97E6|nr:uncharacterized protein LOC122016267 [Zingiber officinale]
MKILSLTTSSSGCERNWSTFEGVHTKKRNRLDTHRLNNLVFVQFNAKLMNKKNREKERNIEVLLANDASSAQDWIVDGADDEVEHDTGMTWKVVSDAMGADEALRPRRSSRLRELDEDDFQSESEEEVSVYEFDFESDEEHVIEEYGEGEEFS